MPFQIPLKIEIVGTALKYINSLDRPTRQRIVEKLRAISENPLDSRLSLPLANNPQRRARVGDYRILFELNDTTLTVAKVGSRGQVYR